MDFLLVELFLAVTEPVPLDRSTRGIGFRVEPQDHFAPAEVREAHRFSVVRSDREVRRRGAYCQHVRLLSFAARKAVDDFFEHNDASP